MLTNTAKKNDSEVEGQAHNTTMERQLVVRTFKQQQLHKHNINAIVEHHNAKPKMPNKMKQQIEKQAEYRRIKQTTETQEAENTARKYATKQAGVRGGSQ